LRAAFTPRARTLRIVLDDVERRARLAYAISEAMRRRRLTAPKVGAKIGRSAETVRRWADGRNVPSVLDVGPLADALGVSVDYLVNPLPVPEYAIDDYLIEDDEPTVEDADRALDELLAGEAASTLQQPTRDRRATGGGSGTGRPARGA
jgi:transcriptional regulator with XRE-family HTH domain